MTGDTLDEVTADAHRLAAELSGGPADAADGEQAETPWLNKALGGFDGSNSAGGGGERPAPSGSKAVDAHIRRVVIGE